MRPRATIAGCAAVGPIIMALLPRHRGGAYDDLCTFDCEPTLTDSQVLEFCKGGFIKLDGVVPGWVNQKCFERCAEIDSVPNDLRKSKGIVLPNEPSVLLSEDWFVDNVILNPAVAGAIRSLLGSSFGLPILVSNHRHIHDEATAVGQGWHQDGDALLGPELHNLQVFYYPQDVTDTMGPTAVFPGSQHTPVATTDGKIDGYPNEFKGTLTTGVAGTVFITHYGMLHRRAPSSDAGPLGCRNLLKYQYWRTTPPARDWLIEPDFDHHTADYQTIGGVPYHGRSYIGTPLGSSVSLDRFAAEQLFWLSALPLPPMRGGQGWPSSGSKENCITKKTYAYEPHNAAGEFGQTLSTWNHGGMHPTGGAGVHGSRGSTEREAALEARLGKMEALLEQLLAKL